ncbi:MAG: methionyl-tRNA formyltransferase [Pseudomonadota bacterium]
MRLIFMGTPDFSVPVLQALLDDGHDVDCVYSQPPRPAGRGMEERKSPVHLLAEQHGLNVRTPASLKADDDRRAFADLGAEAAVVVAYGLILPEPVLQAPEHGCFNVHASLLPRWRGAAPIQRAIMAGDEESGVGIMRMEKGLDTGPVCLEKRVPISANMTAEELHDQLSVVGAEAMTEALAQLAGGTLACTPQPEEGVTYAAKIDKQEAKIDFSKPAAEVHNHIRGLSPFPGAWFELPGSQPVRIKVLRTELTEAGGAPGAVLDEALTIACGTGAVRLIDVQRAGKGVMTAADFLRGTAVSAGTVVQ